METIMKFREDLVLRQVGGDYIIVDPSQEMVDMTKVFSLNKSAAWLLEQLMGTEFTTELMVDLLTSRFDVSANVAEQDVKKLIELLKNNGLLI